MKEESVLSVDYSAADNLRSNNPVSLFQLADRIAKGFGSLASTE